METLFLWLLRIVAGLVGVVLLLLAVSYGYQRLATWRDKRAYPPPGQLVDVGWLQNAYPLPGHGQPDRNSRRRATDGHTQLGMDSAGSCQDDTRLHL